jgi:hypothetical protein
MRLFSFYLQASDVGETHSLVPATVHVVLPSCSLGFGNVLSMCEDEIDVKIWLSSVTLRLVVL